MGLSNRTIVPVPVPVDVPPGHWRRESSHVPKPVSPLMRSLTVIINGSFRKMFTEMGVLPDTLEFREIGGWVYNRVVPPGGGPDRKPPPPLLMPVLVRVVPVLRQKVKSARDAVRSDRFGRYLDQWFADWRPNLVAEIAGLRRVDLTALDEAALDRHVDDVLDLVKRAWDVHFILHGANAYFLGDLAFTCRDLLGWDDAKALALVSGLSSASTTPAGRIAELAVMARERPAVLALLEEDAPDLERLAAADPEFAAAFAAYQDEFGFRCIRYEVAEPSVAEVPGMTLRLIADQARSGFDPTVAQVELERRRQALRVEADQILASRPVTDRARFERALARAERFYPVREDNAPMTYSEPVALVRRVAREIGRRLADGGMLEETDDVFFLELKESRESLAALGRGEKLDRRDLVARRMGERAWIEAHPGPASYGTDPGVPSFKGLPPEARFANEAALWLVDRIFAPVESQKRQAGGSTLTGIPAAAGTYTGTVRVLLGEADFPKLQPGDVLVCPVTSPAWSPIFPNISALVTDSGGLLSHPAIIAREFGVPAVVGTGNATELLKDGQQVTVDGTAGTIKLHP